MAEKNKKMRRQYRRTLLGLFLTLLLFIPLLSLLLGDRDFSLVENRTLKQMPLFTLSAVKDGSYMKDLTGYLEDQFPGRDQFIGLKARMERLLLRMESNDVYIMSRDDLIDKFKPDSDELTREKAAAINAFAREHPRMKLSIMLVPTKSEILKDQLPPFAPEASQKEYLDKFLGLLSRKVSSVDLLPVFTGHREESLFFKSDHHWTQAGAFLAQGAYLASLGLDAREAGEYGVRRVARDFQGSLASKSGIAPAAPDGIDLYIPKEPEDIVVSLTEEQRKLTSFYQLDSLEGQDKYLAFLGGNYPVVRISTDSTADRRLLIIKDSYANAFVPFMTRDFNEITMVDLRYYTGDINQLVEDYLITDGLILYNMNTFNDDNSILNIADTLSGETAGDTEGDGADGATEGDKAPAEPPLEASVQANPHVYGQFYVNLRNTSEAEVTYSRRLQLQKLAGEKWTSLKELPGFSWDEEERTLGAGANAQYLIDLEEAFGSLEEGRYRLIQTYDGAKSVTCDFPFAGSYE